MATQQKTGFDRHFAKRMKNAAFAAEDKTTRTQTDAVDALVRALDAAREDAGLTKAALAQRADIKPEQVRRLFTAQASNPTVMTLVKLATALDCTVALTPRVGRRARPARLAARDARR